MKLEFINPKSLYQMSQVSTQLLWNKHIHWQLHHAQHMDFIAIQFFIIAYHFGGRLILILRTNFIVVCKVGKFSKYETPQR